MNFFSNNEIEDLGTLWQLRHSIVHTGDWLTIPDSQKVSALIEFGGHPFFMEATFIEAVDRRLHSIVKKSIQRLDKGMQKHLPKAIIKNADYKELVELTSPRKT